MGDILDLPTDVKRVGGMAASGGQPLNEYEVRYLQWRMSRWFFQTADGPELRMNRVREDWLLQLAYRHRLFPAPFAEVREVQALLVATMPEFFPRRSTARPELISRVRDYRWAVGILGGADELAMWTVTAGGEVVPIVCSEMVAERLIGPGVYLKGAIGALRAGEEEFVENQW